jgi:hypothetical protein
MLPSTVGKKHTGFLALFSLLVIGGASRSTPLPPDGTIVNVGSRAAPQGTLVADTGVDSLSLHFDGNPAHVTNFTFQEQVYRNDPANPFGTGNLSFVYKVDVTRGFISKILSASILPKVATDVGLASTTGPTGWTATRFNNIGYSALFQLDRNNPLTAGESVTLVIDTNYSGDPCPYFLPNRIALAEAAQFNGLGGGGPDTNCYGVGNLPEPPSLMLFGTLGAGLFLAVWRRRAYA